MVTAYVALDSRVLVVRGDDNWEPTIGLDDGRTESLDASSERPERAFLGTVDRGLKRSTDGGETFERVATDTIDDRVTAVTVSPHDPDTVWAGTEPSRMYRSVDGGDTWELRPGLTDLPSASEWSFPPRPETHHVRCIEPDPHEPGRLYVAIEAGALLRTEDAGATWRDRPNGARLDNHTIATHSDAPGRVYVAAGDGYAESTDGGDTWSYPQQGLDHRYVWSIAVDPADPDRVVVSAAESARRAHRPETAESSLYRRSDDGGWTLDMDGMAGPEGVSRAVLDAYDGRFFAANDHGLYHRGVRDRSWSLAVDWSDSWGSSVARGLAVVA